MSSSSILTLYKQRILLLQLCCTIHMAMFTLLISNNILYEAKFKFTGFELHWFGIGELIPQIYDLPLWEFMRKTGESISLLYSMDQRLNKAVKQANWFGHPKSWPDLSTERHLPLRCCIESQFVSPRKEEDLSRFWVISAEMKVNTLSL